MLLAPSAASAATITVDSTADPSSPPSGCTLHDAITAANTNGVVNGCAAGAVAGTDTIDFSLPNPSTITLAGALPDITSDIDITGPGMGQLTISGADAVRPFQVTGAPTDSISGMTITHGLSTLGGAVNNAGTLTLTDVALIDNNATVAGGTNAFPAAGAIRSNGAGATLHLVLSTVSGNTVTGSGATNQNGADGGGIRNGAGTLTLDRSTVSDNQANASGGTFAQANGGGIDTSGPVTITQSTISDNTASGSGASTASGATGGGIASNNSPAVTISLDRTTLTGNSVSAPPGNASDGGIDAYGSAFTVTSSTISGNSAPLYANVQFHLVSGIAFKNTIVSNPLGGGANCSGPNAGSLGFNLESANSCGFSQATDQPSTDPLLAASLADNGGPTQTLALLTGSPAIDAGLSSLGENVDQRGLTRPVDLSAVPNAPGSDGTDIGAFEVQAPVVPPPGGGGGSTAPVPPDTSLSAKVRKRKHKATFTFTSSDPSSTFMCKLDKRPLAPCSSPKVYKHLGFGQHRFSVAAQDLAGHVDPTPASFRFKLKRP